jgi:hypothetical protein
LQGQEPEEEEEMPSILGDLSDNRGVSDEVDPLDKKKSLFDSAPDTQDQSGGNLLTGILKIFGAM